MKSFCALVFMLMTCAAGCGDPQPRTVTDGVDQQAIRDYEAALAKVTSQDIKPEKE
tara:strand:+ start:1211 stop:1378 length:168 start_codon:yes stop_codon:yes gene_type:complete